MAAADARASCLVTQCLRSCVRLTFRGGPHPQQECDPQQPHTDIPFGHSRGHSSHPRGSACHHTFNTSTTPPHDRYRHTHTARATRALSSALPNHVQTTCERRRLRPAQPSSLLSCVSLRTRHRTPLSCCGGAHRCSPKASCRLPCSTHTRSSECPCSCPWLWSSASFSWPCAWPQQSA